MLKYYKEERARNQRSTDQYHRMRSRLGDKELERRAAEALRAMADKIEQPGMHFMIGCDLPTLPILSDYVCGIEVTLVKGPLGG